MGLSTWKQTIANRLNALRSTGPRSAEGKARSSQNARKHGLSKVGEHPPAEMAEAIERRKLLWESDYGPEGPTQQWTFGRLVAESVRLDLCEARIGAARLERALRASESWDDDRAAEVAQLASRLPRQPDRIQAVLLQSKHGVLWLLDRWAELEDVLSRQDGWTQENWGQALDLLGMPASARAGSGPWELHPSDSGSGPGLGLVAEAVAALRDRLDGYLADRDERARLDAELGLEADDPPELRRLERYAADARRRFTFFGNELRRLQAHPSSRADAASIPASSSSSALLPTARPPGPRPERPPSRPAANSSTIAAPPAAAPVESPRRNEPDRPEPATAPEPISIDVKQLRNEPAAGISLGRGRPLGQAMAHAALPVNNRRARRARAAAKRRP